MSRRTRISFPVTAVIATLAVGVPATAVAQNDRPLDAYWYCYSWPGGDPIYVTAAWEARAAPVDVRAEFVEMLAAKYGYQGHATCSGATKGSPEITLARHQDDAKAMFAHYANQGKKIVDTGWTGTAPTSGAVTPASSAGIAPAADGAAAAPTHWAACKIDRLASDAKSVVTGPYNTYISDVFPIDPKTNPDIVKLFGEFVSANYGHERDNPLCNVRTSESGVRAMHEDWIDEATKIGKAIPTGWKYGQ
jgi:hypothetical protein